MRRFLLVSIPAMLGFPRVVNAQETSFALSPSVIHLQPRISDPDSAKINLTNLSSNTITLAYDTIPLDILTDGSPFIRSENQSYKAVFEALQIQEDNQPISSITLAPQESKQITVTIKAPQQSTYNEYSFALVFAEQKSLPDTTTSVSSINKHIATNIIVSIDKQEQNKQPVITKLSYPAFSTGSGPVTLHLEVKNPNTTAQLHSGSVTVTNMFGKTIYDQSLEPVLILGEHSRQMSTQHSSDGKITWNDSFLFGKYTIITRIENNAGQVVSLTNTHIGIPAISLIFITIFLFMVINFWLRVLKKTR